MSERDTMGHEAVDGSHSHAHSPYGAQGEDATHGHVHAHHGDSAHEHDHSGRAVAVPAATVPPLGMSSFVAAATVPAMEAAAVEPAPLDLRGAQWGVEQRGDGWQVLTAAGDWSDPAGSYAEALGVIAEQLAGQNGARPVLDRRWRSDMAFEGVSTGDGRRISPGAIEFRPCPLPLMLQTVTDSGHLGAVLAGTIEATGMVGQTAVGSGTFDATDAGRQFVSIIDARGRFGVSIDVMEADGEFECTEMDADGECTDGEMVFSLVRQGGLTGTPFPAFESAMIEFDSQTAEAVAASAACECGGVTSGATVPPCDVTAPAAEVDGGGPEMHVTVTPHVSFSFASQPLVAAGGPSAPSAEWFADPQFGGTGDPRVVRQPDGQYLCPLTVTAEGRVFGHFAGWNTCHTAYSAACVTPPHSQTGYAAFMLRPLLTAEGDVIQVGHISMGCGHIPDDGTVPLRVVRDHYDGGPGAILMARVRVGEDAHGGWFAGALAEDVTDAQVRKFSSLSVSGHWREVWRGKGLDLLACVAGVPVPGFPVSAMAAAGFVPAETDVLYRLPDPQVVLREGRPIVLVAAGVVRQPFPWERAMAAQQNQIEALSRRLDRAERITAALRPVVATGLREPFAGTDAEPEPIPPGSLLANAANGRRH